MMAGRTTIAAGPPVDYAATCSVSGTRVGRCIARRSWSSPSRSPTATSAWCLRRPAGHLGAGLAEVGVHRGDADVEPRQEVRVPVDGPVRGGIQLGAVQQRHCAAVCAGLPGQSADQGADLPPLGEHLLVGHPLHEQVRRVVGDRVIGIAPVSRGGHHLLQRGHPVGEAGVGVQVTADIGFGDQVRELAAQRDRGRSTG